MARWIDGIKKGDILVVEGRHGAEQFFIVNNVNHIDNIIYSTGISISGVIFRNSSIWDFHRKATDDESLEMERILERHDCVFDVNTKEIRKRYYL